jgi:hypothetical protein
MPLVERQILKRRQYPQAIRFDPMDQRPSPPADRTVARPHMIEIKLDLEADTPAMARPTVCLQGTSPRTLSASALSYTARPRDPRKNHNHSNANIAKNPAAMNGAAESSWGAGLGGWGAGAGAGFGFRRSGVGSGTCLGCCWSGGGMSARDGVGAKASAAATAIVTARTDISTSMTELARTQS